MRYEKPSIAVIGEAVQAIQGIHKPNSDVDSCESSTAAAYEADE